MEDYHRLNTLRYNPDLCTGCAMCAVVCPHAVFAIHDEKAELIHPEDCMECGACELNCPSQAITVESGVGCATAMMWAALSRKKEATCPPSCCT